MSTEKTTAAPSAPSQSASASMQPAIAAEHAAKPQPAVQARTAVLATAGSATAAHACCHDVSTASPAVTIGSPNAAETRTPAAEASHPCTHHKADAGLQSLVKELESGDVAARVAAVMALGKSADCAAAAPLIGALGDADADVAREAAAALGVLGDASAVEPLIAVLQNADGYFHPVVRAAAIFSLGQLHDLRAFEPLVQAINDPIAEASAEAIRSLATLADPRGVAPLLAVIRNEDGFFLPTARRAAILGLAKLGGEQAECELRFVSTNQYEDAVIRDAAIDAVSASAPAAV